MLRDEIHIPIRAYSQEIAEDRAMNLFKKHGVIPIYVCNMPSIAG
jgi:hypothetical protein